MVVKAYFINAGLRQISLCAIQMDFFTSRRIIYIFNRINILILNCRIETYQYQSRR